MVCNAVLRGRKYLKAQAANFWSGLRSIGAGVASMEADAHDQLCAWISHLPQMISTALAATLVDEYGEDAPLLETGGRALREMTRISASPVFHVARRRAYQQEKYRGTRC